MRKCKKTQSFLSVNISSNFSLEGSVSLPGLSVFLFGWLLMLGVMSAKAATFIPLSLNGNVSYNYGYITSEGSESDNTGLSASVNMSGYFWQPWFITSNFGLTLGLTRSASSGGTESSSVATAGSFGMEVFPRSRFPFSFSFNRSDSRLDYTNDLTISTTNQFINSRFYLKQSYIGRQSLLADASWIHNENESRFDDSSSDIFNASLRMKKEKHFFHATTSYSTSDSKLSTLKPESYVVNVDHNYLPGAELGVASTVGYINNKSTAAGLSSSTEVTQASSFFSWRPEHKPYTLSGGARFASAAAESNGQTDEINDININIGLDYRITTRLKFSGTASLGATDGDSGQSTQSSQAGSLSYNSEQYSIAGFNYSWNTIGSLSNNTSEIDDVKEDTQSLSAAFGHRAMRNFVIGRITTMNFSVSESFTDSVTQDNEGEVEDTLGMSHSANLGFNFRGRSGSTFMSLNASDSRSKGEDQETVFQLFNAVISRNQLLSRLSSLSATATMQVTRQDVTDAETSTSKSLFASSNYSHGRFLGVYSLQFTSSLNYQRTFKDTDSSEKDTLEWTNRFNYRVGLLDTSLLYRVVTNSDGNPTQSLNFRATRSF